MKIFEKIAPSIGTSDNPRCKSGAIDAMGLSGPQGDSSIEFNRRREEEAFNGSGDGGAAI